MPVKEQLREIFGGKTQVKIAEHLTAHGLTTTQSTVSAWLRGRMPDLDQLAQIEDIYEVPRGTVLVRAGYIAGELADAPTHSWQPPADDLVAAVREAIAEGQERSMKMDEVVETVNQAGETLAELAAQVAMIADFVRRREAALSHRPGELE